MKKTFRLISLILALCAPSIYSMDVKTYMENSSSNLPILYISGVGDGYLFANASVKSERKVQSLYCQPSSLSLNGYNYKNILDDELKSGRYSSDTPISVVLLRGLQRTFPCK